MGDKEEKSEKKEKKDKKDKSEKKDNDVKKDKDKPATNKPTVDANLDQRKLFKEGQKQITPPVADATRGFYSSLLQENPNSKIAVKYAIEFGLLPLDEHNKLLKRYNKMKELGEFNVGTKTKLMIEQKMRSKVKAKNGGKENKENEKAGEKKEKKDKEGKETKDKKDKKRAKKTRKKKRKRTRKKSKGS